MQDFERAIEVERRRIDQVRAGNDDALKDLCRTYQPLISCIKRRYHVRYYDSQDWDQDALIVCYRAVQKFNDNKGRFGSYYKTLLTNHAKSLVRYDAAYRRRALTQAISLENAAAEGLSPLRQNFAQTAAVPLSENLKELVAHLSNLELSALLLALGTMKYEEIKRKYHFSRLMLVRARARVLQKMRRLLLS